MCQEFFTFRGNKSCYTMLEEKKTFVDNYLSTVTAFIDLRASREGDTGRHSGANLHNTLHNFN